MDAAKVGPNLDQVSDGNTTLSRAVTEDETETNLKQVSVGNTTLSLAVTVVEDESGERKDDMRKIVNKEGEMAWEKWL